MHEVFDELATGLHRDREPAEVLHDAGHGELPGELVSEAIASFAGTTGIEVAEHLAPFVTAAGGGLPGLDGLALLATTPLAAQDLDADALATAADGHFGDEVPSEPSDAGADTGADSLDFGIGELATDAATDTADAAADSQFDGDLPLETAVAEGQVDGDLPSEPQPELVDDFGEGAGGAGVADGEPDFGG